METSLDEIKKFEAMNEIFINVYCLDEKENMYPLKVSHIEKEDRTNLLLIKNGERQRYVNIKNFEKLIGSQITKHKEWLHICKRCFTHFDT
jgi:general stress protein 26